MSAQIKALFLDMDGVLWRDLQPIGDIKSNLETAHKKGFQLAFITNNATRTVDHYIRVFMEFGVSIQPAQIYTSAFITSQTLQKRWPDGGAIFMIGEKGLESALRDHNFTLSPKNPLAVVVGLDRQLSYDKLSQATLLIHSGIPFYATNPDATLPSPDGLIPGAGAIVSALETASGVQATVIGKPQASMLEAAMTDLDLEAEQVLMIGDRLETDIAAGQTAGCQSALVLSGACSRADLENWAQAPNYVANDLSDLLEML